MPVRRGRDSRSPLPSFRHSANATFAHESRAGNAGFAACILNGFDACTLIVTDRLRTPSGSPQAIFACGAEEV